MTYRVTYVTEAAKAAVDWAGIGEDRAWALACEHVVHLTTWKLMDHPPEVAGRALACMAWGAGPGEALLEALRSVGRPILA